MHLKYTWATKTLKFVSVNRKYEFSELELSRVYYIALRITCSEVLGTVLSSSAVLSNQLCYHSAHTRSCSYTTRSCAEKGAVA